MVKTKVVIAEDHKIISDTYKLLLESEGISVVGVVNDGVELIEWLKHNDVDVILLDIEMPKMDGISVAKYFVTNNMNYKVLIVSSHYSDSFVEACKAELNIKGFITKDYCHLELTKAEIEILNKNRYFDLRQFNRIGKHIDWISLIDDASVNIYA